MSGLRADTLLTSARSSTKRAGLLRSRVKARAKAALTGELPSWAISWTSPEDPRPSPPVCCIRSAQAKAAMWRRPNGEHHPAQDPPLAGAAVWPKSLPPFSEAKPPTFAPVPAAYTATLGLPEMRRRSRTLPCTEPS